MERMRRNWELLVVIVIREKEKECVKRERTEHEERERAPFNNVVSCGSPLVSFTLINNTHYTLLFLFTLSLIFMLSYPFIFFPSSHGWISLKIEKWKTNFLVTKLNFTITNICSFIHFYSERRQNKIYLNTQHKMFKGRIKKLRF